VFLWELTCKSVWCFTNLCCCTQQVVFGFASHLRSRSLPNFHNMLYIFAAVEADWHNAISAGMVKGICLASGWQSNVHVCVEA
jgi:hypothetical protein